MQRSLSPSKALAEQEQMWTSTVDDEIVFGELVDEIGFVESACNATGSVPGYADSTRFTDRMF